MDCKISTAKANHFFQQSLSNSDLAELVLGCEQFAISINCDPPRYKDGAYVCLARDSKTGIPVGFTYFYIFDDTESMPAELYESWSYVNPEYRNEHVYEQLISYLRKICYPMAIHKIGAHVLKSNKPSINAHKQLGFVHGTSQMDKEMDKYDLERYECFQLSF